MWQAAEGIDKRALRDGPLGEFVGGAVAGGLLARQVSTRILGRRTAPFPHFLFLPNRVPLGANPSTDPNRMVSTQVLTPIAPRRVAGGGVHAAGTGDARAAGGRGARLLRVAGLQDHAAHGGPSSPTTNPVYLCGACALNAAGQSRVTLIAVVRAL